MLLDDVNNMGYSAADDLWRHIKWQISQILLKVAWLLKCVKIGVSPNDIIETFEKYPLNITYKRNISATPGNTLFYMRDPSRITYRVT